VNSTQNDNNAKPEPPSAAPSENPAGNPLTGTSKPVGDAIPVPAEPGMDEPLSPPKKTPSGENQPADDKAPAGPVGETEPPPACRRPGRPISPSVGISAGLRVRDAVIARRYEPC
jgi:hypothetical protein